ncbi:putative DNA-binding protein [Paenibacillus sp. GYB003]|uniref:putative DNA-binding protein n=1 Tax=Paenibacillus sp. GYB003 TaxID=2994392 RepID=UPI002F96CD1F
MTGEQSLDKTNRINMLFDIYGPLLTEKQQTFLGLYFHDDYSLGEIAAEFEISRQAVYEHIKRAEQTLEEYETKLKLLEKHERRRELSERIEAIFGGPAFAAHEELKRLVRSLYNID